MFFNAYWAWLKYRFATKERNVKYSENELLMQNSNLKNTKQKKKDFAYSPKQYISVIARPS